MYKLNEEEKKFAAENYRLVYKFLKDKNYNLDNFCDIAFIGYLRAVKKYNSITELKKYSFSTIAWRCMETEIYNDFNKANNIDKFTCFLNENILTKNINPDSTIRNFVDCIYSNKKKKLLILLFNGYTKKEISELMNIKKSELKNEIEQIKTMYKNYCLWIVNPKLYQN